MSDHWRLVTVQERDVRPHLRWITGQRGGGAATGNTAESSLVVAPRVASVSAVELGCLADTEQAV